MDFIVKLLRGADALASKGFTTNVYFKHCRGYVSREQIDGKKFQRLHYERKRTEFFRNVCCVWLRCQIEKAFCGT